MGLEIGKKEEEPVGETYKLTEKLYKTEDGEVVRAGTGRAASVYKPAGARIPIEEAREIGLIEAPKPKAEPKKAEKSADKKRTPAKNKSRSKKD